jgi:membrane dipeptidase
LSALVGPEHVGLGLDFAVADDESYDYFGYDERYYPRPPWIYPAGIRGWADVPGVTAGLQARGYTENQIRGILGENFLRVFERVWGA